MKHAQAVPMTAVLVLVGGEGGGISITSTTIIPAPTIIKVSQRDKTIIYGIAIFIIVMLLYYLQKKIEKVKRKTD